RTALRQPFRAGGESFQRWLFHHIPIPGGSRVLELGCGTGWFWHESVDDVSPDSTLVLTDFSEGMVREARAATAALPCAVGVAVADAGALPFRDGSADVVVANFMLYHVPDLDRTLEEVRRVLADGGVLCAATIGETHLR